MPNVIHESLINIDINKIMSAANHMDNRITYELTLHTPDYNINITLLKFVEKARDYNGSFGDDIRVCFVMRASDYKYKIFKCKDLLEASLLKKTGNNTSIKRYKAFIVSDTGEMIQDALYKLDDHSLDSNATIELELQLVDLEIYALSAVDTVGVYNNATMKDVLVSDIVNSFNSVSFGTGSLSEKIYLDLVEPDNTNTYGQVIIPTGTKTINLPSFLQSSNSYGIYNAGLGTYFQKYNYSSSDTKDGYLFIYPLFDVKRFDKANYKAMFFLPHLPTQGLDRTFTVDGDVLKIIPRYDKTTMNFGDNALTSIGDGIAFADNDNISRSFRNIENGKTVSGSSSTDMKVQTMKERKDGRHNINYIGPTNNPYRARSELIKNTLTLFQFKWEKCDIDLIYPGMPCCVIYENHKEEIVKLKGIIQSTAELYTEEHHTCSGMVNVLVMNEDVFRTMDEKYNSNIK